MKILFLANTTTQVFNAAILSHTTFDIYKCDVYYTKNVETQVKYYKDEGYFENVYKIELVADVMSRRNMLTRSIVRIKNALDLKKIIKNLPSNPKEYERVLASGVSLRNFEYYYAIKKINKNVKFSLYEEGICEYVELSCPKDYFKILFSKIFFRHFIFEDCDSLYVHSPAMVVNKWGNIEIKEIPSILENENFKKDTLKAFNYQGNELNGVKNKFIIIEQAFPTQEEDKIQQQLITSITKEAGKENVFIKLHPRSHASKYTNYNTFSTKIPLEVIALNEEIFGNVFVSITSSAVANFKLFFDREPTVILLSQCLKKNSDIYVTDFFDRLKGTYKENNFYFPKDYDEFLRIVRNIK